MTSFPLEGTAALVRERTGLVFSDARRPAFEVAVAAAMRRARIRDPQVYAARLAANPAALDDLVDAITVGETYFFRELGQLVNIRDGILPVTLAERSGNRPVRVWSAGCATGEEAYSLAILLREQGLDRQVCITGTDISRAAIAKAARGRYTNWSLRDTPAHVRQAYFREVGNHFELICAVRKLVAFRQLNLVGDQYPSPESGIWEMDVIVCRNVLIYFDADTIARVARRLIDSLSPTGWLILGASDPMLADLAPCEVVTASAGLAYRRTSVARRAISARVPEPVLPLPPVEVSPIAPALTAERWPTAGAADGDVALETIDDGMDVAHAIDVVRALANRGDVEAAWQSCAVAVDRHPGAAELVYLQSALLIESERYVEAAAAARRALYLDRGLVVAYMALGGALARLDDTNGARRAFRNAARLLIAVPPGETVPASDGEPAGRLAEMARAQIALLTASVA